MDTTDPNKPQAVTAVPEECDDFDIETLHGGAAEEAQPRQMTFSMPMVVLFAIAAFLSGAYLITLGSGGSTSAAATVDPGPLSGPELGKKIYLNNCKACHQTNGMGTPGQYPPLAGSEWVINGNKRPILILLHGIAGPMTVKGNNYNGNMQAWAGSLDDEQIANVLTYIRQEWGNSAPAVQPEQVAAMRAQYGNRPQYTAEELSQVPLDEDVPGPAADGSAQIETHAEVSGLAAAR